MAYTTLKNDLEKLLNQDIQNRSSLQEMRRNVFLNTETVKKEKQTIAEKENAIRELQSQIETEASLVKQKENSIAELNSIIAELKKQNEELVERNTNELNSLKDAKDAEIFSLIDKYSLIEKSKNEEITNLKSELSGVSQLSENVSKLTLENSFYATKIRELILHVDSQNEKEAKLVSEINELKKSIISATTDKQNLLNQVEELQLALSKVDSSSTGDISESEVLKQRIVLLESQISNAQTLIDSQNKTLQNLEQSNHSATIELTDSITSLSAENGLLIRDNADLIAEGSLLKLENENLSEELNGLKQEYHNLVTKFDEFTAHHTLIVNELKHDKKMLSSDLEFFKNEVGLIAKNNSSNSSEQQVEIETLQFEVENLNQKINSITDNFNFKIAEIENEKLNLQNQLNQIQQSDLGLNNLFTSNNTDEEFTAGLMKKIDFLGEEKINLENQVNSLRNQITELTQTIDNQSTELLNLEERNKQSKLAQALLMGTKDKTQMKLQINELVREIDKCIALLNS